jgi:hypothetical protein
MANSLDLFIFLLASQLGEHLYEFVHVYIPEKYIPEKYIPEKYIPEKYIPEKYIPEKYIPEKYIPEKYIPEKFYINVLFNSMNIYKFMIMVSQNICISITWNNIIVNTNKTIF